LLYINGAFEHGSGLKFLGYIQTHPEVLCVEFCDFVQCRTFVNYLPFFIKFHKTVFNWHDNSTNPKLQFQAMFFFIKVGLNIKDTNMAA
jgi:hypothetical protein